MKEIVLVMTVISSQQKLIVCSSKNIASKLANQSPFILRNMHGITPATSISSCSHLAPIEALKKLDGQ